MQDYDINVAPNAPRQIDAAGDWLYFYAGSAGGADATLRVKGIHNGTSVQLQPGQAYRLPRGQVETSWVLTNKAGAAPIVGTVIIGKGEITDNRITGSVEVVDGGKNRTLAGQVAIMSILLAPPAAGLNAIGGIWNPANSGKRMVCKRVHVSSPTAQSINLSPIAGVLANTLTPRSLKVDGAAYSGPMLGTWLNTATAAATLGGNLGALGVYDIAAGVGVQLALEEPMVILPGNGVVASAAVAATGLTVNVAFYEEAV